MITYEKFLQIGLRLQKINKRTVDLSEKYNLDLFEFEDDYIDVITTCLKEIFNREQYDWFEWFCYENDFGQKGLEARDKNGKLICQTWEQLYKTIKKLDD